LLGWLVTVTTFKVAWLLMAGVGIVASGLIMVSRQRMIVARDRAIAAFDHTTS
jgi:hypothetical protein